MSTSEGLSALQTVADTDPTATLIVIGGDGTLHTLLPALVGSQLRLGVIPAGSGNDLARAMGIPRHPEKALQLLLKGKTKRIDILSCGTIYCATVIGCGIDGTVAKAVNTSKLKGWFNKLGLGNMIYVWCLLKVLFKYPTYTVQLNVDGTTHTYERVWLIAAANTSSYGGGMQICPDASSSDGTMDICIVHGISRLELLLVFPLVFSGKHVKHRAVSILQGKRTVIRHEDEMNNELCAHADGELIDSAPLCIRLLPSALQIIGADPDH